MQSPTSSQTEALIKNVFVFFYFLMTGFYWFIFNVALQCFSTFLNMASFMFLYNKDEGLQVFCDMKLSYSINKI
ncbi:hypothetical protein FHQ69_18250 [Escherichia coli]|nr:hypothetical protein [Escherichia coli]